MRVTLKQKLKFGRKREAEHNLLVHKIAKGITVSEHTNDVNPARIRIKFCPPVKHFREESGEPGCPPVSNVNPQAS